MMDILELILSIMYKSGGYITHHPDFVLTLVIGALALYIAYQQYLTNKNSHKFSLYHERRIIYNSIDEILEDFLSNPKFNNDLYYSFYEKTRTTIFLFDEDII